MLDPRVLNAEGLNLYQKGRIDDAIAKFDEAIEISPREAEPYFNRGNAYYAKGEFNKAILDFNKAMEIDPTFMEEF